MFLKCTCFLIQSFYCEELDPTKFAKEMQEKV